MAAADKGTDKREYNKLQLFTVKEVTELLKLSRQSVYNYINSGELESFTLGSSRRITAAALERFINKKAGQAQDPAEN